MKGQSDRPEKHDADARRARTVKILCFVLFGVFAAAAVACVIAYAVTRHDVLFIPIALCAVAAMISFTYGRVSSR